MDKGAVYWPGGARGKAKWPIHRSHDEKAPGSGPGVGLWEPCCAEQVLGKSVELSEVIYIN